MDQNTAIALTGLFLLAGGLLLVWAPLSPIVVGGLLIAYAVLPDQKPEVEPNVKPDVET